MYWELLFFFTLPTSHFWPKFWRVKNGVRKMAYEKGRTKNGVRKMAHEKWRTKNGVRKMAYEKWRTKTGVTQARKFLGKTAYRFWGLTMRTLPKKNYTPKKKNNNWEWLHNYFGTKVKKMFVLKYIQWYAC